MLNSEFLLDKEVSWASGVTGKGRSEKLAELLRDFLNFLALEVALLKLKLWLSFLGEVVLGMSGMLKVELLF